MFLTELSDRTLGNKQPILRASGTAGDISPILSFQWLEPVYFKTHDTSFPSESPEVIWDILLDSPKMFVI